ncbi:hypothetical protein PFLUV_G00206350 [Perca fluviatilis]|uniref:Uncharacterized protein n=1 Tax=Perca fluviatilis TaxID=8168 RepID=A0A6A5DUQ7_PERFL|nr:hypothetical protein PFLUV_G00206350 [Perca fluviatilis]
MRLTGFFFIFTAETFHSTYLRNAGEQQRQRKKTGREGSNNKFWPGYKPPLPTVILTNTRTLPKQLTELQTAVSITEQQHSVRSHHVTELQELQIYFSGPRSGLTRTLKTQKTHKVLHPQLLGSR